ncbi:hypothetical protein GUH85_19385, partial [Xanthomonas citri pv. citri]|nr:hypothetical protein [Xanthomonas citri pv. citri]
LPEVFKNKASQRTLLESFLTLESITPPYFVGGQNGINNGMSQNSQRPKPCSALRKACQRTMDCCTGYCSVTDEDEGGFCNDPIILKD